MLRILWNSKSGMMAQQDKLDCISNNLSNLNTAGYKRLEVAFKDLMYETLNRQGYPITDNGNRKVDPYTGTGVKTSGWIRQNTQGNLNETSMPTDLAIDGEGYFQITTPNGYIQYTRAGKFNIDALGRLVSDNGNLLNIQFNRGYSYNNVSFNKDNFLVDSNGDIYLREVGNVPVGKINLYTAVGSDSFISVGENLYEPRAGIQVTTVDKPTILQGYNEMSNVDMVTEMTEMLITQRAFELGSRGIKTADEMWGMVNNLRGK